MNNSSKYFILIVLFCFITMSSQTDTGLTYKSFAYVSAAKGGNIQIIDNISKSFFGSIGIISADTNWRNSGKTLGISKDGQWLFQDSYGLSTTTQIISLATNTIVSGINFSNGGGMIYSPDGNTIYAAPAYYILKYTLSDQTVSTFSNRNTGTCNSTNPNEAYTSLRLAISSNGNNLYVGNLDPRKKGISVYNTTTGTEVKIHSGISGVQKLSCSPDDAFVYICNTSWGYGACTNDPNLMIDIYGNNTNHSSDIAILNTATNTIVDYLNLGSISDVVVSNDGAKIYVGTSTGVKVISRDLSTNTHTISSENYATGAVTHLGLEPNGNFLYVVSTDILKLINLSNGTISTITTTTESNKSLGNIVFSSYYSPPIGLSVSTNSTNNNSNLNWTAVASPNLSNYKIYGGTSLSNLQLIGTANAGTESFIHTGLSEGVTYYYKISAVDSNNNESIKSTSVLTTTAFLPPIITGPNSETGPTSSISLNENNTAVHTFSADESVTWSLGNTNDEALFTIDSSGNLVFATAPDFETPASTLNSNTYVVDVVATDTSNNATTQTISITILDVANTTFGTFASITEEYFTGTHTIVAPTSNNSNPIVYSSDNTAVATVSGSVITFTGVGTATISATQSTDASFEGGTVSAVLTVLGKDLVSKYGGISSTDTNYVDANGKVGGNNGIGKYGDKNQVKPLQNSLRLTASNSEYLTFPKAVGLNASADFTFETWIKFNSIGTYQMDPIFGGGQADYVSIYGGNFAARINVNNPCSGDRNFFNYSLITTNVWHHIALVRSGSTITAYLDGVAKGTTSCTGVFMNSLSTVYIGKNTWRSGFLNADISNMRYVVGTALYTSNFTPPTTVLTAIPGTQFLFLANDVSNPLKDSSVNNVTVTPFGSPTLIIGNGPF